MKKILNLSLLLILFSCNNSKQDGLAELKTAPFTAVKLVGEEVKVKAENEWFQLLKISNWNIETILSSCEVMYGEGCLEMLSEDLVEFLNAIDIYPSSKEQFTLLNKRGEEVTKEMSFTRKNRSVCKDFFNENFIHEEDLDFDQVITDEVIEEDILYLENILTKYYSYLNLKELNLPTEIQEIKMRLQGENNLLDFSLEIQRLLNKFGDGHCRIENIDLNQYGVLPFSLSEFNGNIICHKDKKLFNENYPYLKVINSIDVEQLMQTVNEYLVPDGSPQFIEKYGARSLKKAAIILRINNALKGKEVEVVFSKNNGDTHKQTVKLEFPGKKNKFSKISDLMSNPFEVSILENNIGYVKIERMISLNTEKKVNDMMEKVRKTKGLIIDVRNNGGGSREITTELLPYFMQGDRNSVIGNVAVFRTDHPEKLPLNGVLQNRFLYPFTYNKFTDLDFTPKYKYDSTKYSAMHYFLVKAKETEFKYDKPMVVLMNARCFSATDIFLSTFGELENVTLMGAKSGGGSARSKKYTLPNSKLKLKLGSIISYQPNGELYDGNGVSPDVEILPETIQDVINSDNNQLREAIKMLTDNSNS